MVGLSIWSILFKINENSILFLIFRIRVKNYLFFDISIESNFLK